MGNIPGIEIDVLTIDPFMSDVREDMNFGLYAEEKFKTITRLKPPNWYKRLPFTRLQSMFSIPDAYLYLNPLYLPHLKNMSQYDVIFTWSMYHSIHLLGRYIKKKNPSIHWVAHFSDPWVNNPYFKQNRLTKIINKHLEQSVFEQANSLLFTSEETIELVLKPYGEAEKKKSKVVPHAFDESLYPNKQKSPNKDFIIRYIGNFYGVRQPTGLIKALEFIYDASPQKLKNLKFEFIGSFVSEKAYEIPEPLRELITFKAPVNYLESLKLMKQSDLLLIIDAPFDTSPFLPSKLIDYIGANKPIFAITPLGTSQKLIEEIGFQVAHPNEPKEIAEKLLKMVEISSAKEILISSSIRDRYNIHSVGAQMCQIIN